MSHSIFETIMGACVLIAALFFLNFAYKSTNFTGFEGYNLYADFSQANGISEGTEVRVSGIRVGSVVSQTLDTETYLATVKMRIQNNVQLPLDTSASITSESLLGGKYLSLEPGGDIDFLTAGDKIIYTQAAPNLEQLLGKFIFNMDGSKKPKDADK